MNARAVISCWSNGMGLELDNKAKSDARRASGNPASKDGKTVKQQTPGKTDKPGWASGLRQLYDSVVDEPLPDQFSELLAQLDRKN
ncbi:NepR family anti-sigma factor [Altererythrobacter sp. TH136]|uniref:NepR family anti-sigma factor n=1 Tax=Altererythrobacter sp. TH136 TaxID=2067415 RepID=UPI0011632AFD|nr:NepR family anti-sigma factor [Altererythrobacter sp. TH136]QDM41509.1 hypothetical protein C0V74_11005 [Altererythrobacter sp. TH136]